MDSVLDTLPLFLVLFTLLGLAAGIKTMMRSAQELQRDTLAKAAETEDDASAKDAGERTKDGG